MSSLVSLQDVANIVTFIAPGYFAAQIYTVIYGKRDRDFSRLVIESAIYSLPIVTLANMTWSHFFKTQIISSLSIKYVLWVMMFSFVIGIAIAFLRMHWPIRRVAEQFGFGSPNEDFVKAQILRLNTKDKAKNAVAVKLKSGPIFSGTLLRMSRYAVDGHNYYYFTNLAKFNDKKRTWEDVVGGLIIERSEVEYIQTLDDK